MPRRLPEAPEGGVQAALCGKHRQGRWFESTIRGRVFGHAFKCVVAGGGDSVEDPVLGDFVLLAQYDGLKADFEFCGHGSEGVVGPPSQARGAVPVNAGERLTREPRLFRGTPRGGSRPLSVILKKLIPARPGFRSIGERA